MCVYVRETEREREEKKRTIQEVFFLQSGCTKGTSFDQSYLYCLGKKSKPLEDVYRHSAFQLANVNNFLLQ